MANSTSTAQIGKVWFITGASSGFGRLLAEYLLTLGANVVATARKAERLADLETPEYEGQVQVLELDVTKPEQVKAAVDAALERFGHVDVLVNNAGFGITGAVEEVSAEEYMPMFETNVFGLIAMTKALLPQFRERKSGNILMLSSVGGLIGLPGWGYYNATKFAVEGLSEALGSELDPLGVYVTLVEPGPFRTEFLGTSGQKSVETIEDYKNTAGKTREYFESQNGKQAGDPQKAVEAMVAVASAEKPPRHLLLGKLALERFRGKAEKFEAEVKAWEETTVGADFPGMTAPNPYK